MEEYRPIKDYEGYYVSNKGNVKHIYLNGKERVFKPSLEKGYLRTTLCLGNKPKHFFIHHLVLNAFVGECPPQYDQVNHIDNNPLNNCVENLEWCDAKMNARHRDMQDRHNRNKRVYQYDEDMNFIAEYWSARECERKTGYSNTSICSWCSGKKPKNNNYIWSYTPLHK